MSVLIDTEMIIPIEELQLCAFQSGFLPDDPHYCNIDCNDTTGIALGEAVVTIFNSTNVSYYMIGPTCEFVPQIYPVNLERLCMRGWMNHLRNTQGGVT